MIILAQPHDDVLDRRDTLAFEITDWLAQYLREIKHVN
jgi:hypothetical protein